MIPIYVLAPIIFFFTFIGTLLILPKLINIASTWIVTKKGSYDEKYSLMDLPDNDRKVHNVPRPLVGGLGMLAIVSFSSLLFVPPTDIGLRGYYSAVILLGTIGFFDDFADLHYSWKFIAQILATIIMVEYSKNALLSFGDILSFGSIDIGIFVAPVTIFCTIGIINAINMIDGVDGLAGGISLIAFISFAILSYINEQRELMLLSIGLSGAVLGFLRYNWYPSKVFMGDAGSFFLGFSLAFLAIAITQTRSHVNIIVRPISALLILAVPVVDTVTVMIKRIIKGRNPFSADQNHFHHLLLRMGLKKTSVVIIILFSSAIFSFLGVMGAIYRGNEHYMFLLFVIYLIIYFFASFFIREA